MFVWAITGTGTGMCSPTATLNLRVVNLTYCKWHTIYSIGTDIIHIYSIWIHWEGNFTFIGCELLSLITMATETTCTDAPTVVTFML